MGLRKSFPTTSPGRLHLFPWQKKTNVTCSVRARHSPVYSRHSGRREDGNPTRCPLDDDMLSPGQEARCYCTSITETPFFLGAVFYLSMQQQHWLGLAGVCLSVSLSAGRKKGNWPVVLVGAPHGPVVLSLSLSLSLSLCKSVVSHKQSQAVCPFATLTAKRPPQLLLYF